MSKIISDRYPLWLQIGHFQPYWLPNISDENLKRNCLDVDDVVKAGPGLSFIAYPEAIGLLPVCQLFSGMIPRMFPILKAESR